MEKSDILEDSGILIEYLLILTHEPERRKMMVGRYWGVRSAARFWLKLVAKSASS